MSVAAGVARGKDSQSVYEPGKLALVSGDSAAVLISLLVLQSLFNESQSFPAAVMLWLMGHGDPQTGCMAWSVWRGSSGSRGWMQLCPAWSLMEILSP